MSGRSSLLLLGLVLVVALLVLTACGTAPGAPASSAPGGRVWDPTGVDGLLTVCTDQGDRIYVDVSAGGFAAVGGGCR